MGVEYSESPNGFLFVKKEQHMGILPTILTELLAARKRAKAQMKTAANEFDAAVYNGKQLALKICANSVYGFCGARTGSVPCVFVSGAVTAYV